MFLLAVNYHYIHEEDRYPFPGIYSTPAERLASQLDQLGRSFEFIGQEDILAALDGSRSLPEKCCIVTFDDGLRSQYENGLPVLRERKIPAIFFVSGQPLVEHRACLVHKIHWLRANLSHAEFLKRMESHLERIPGQHYMDSPELKAIEQNSALYRYDDRDVARVKFLLNRVLPEVVRDKVMGEMFSAACPDEVSFCRQFYMTQEHLRDLYRSGMLGSHSYSHAPLSGLSARRMREEIERNLSAIDSLVPGCQVPAVSYPYGHTEVVSLETALHCQGAGHKFGFTMERAFNRSLAQPLLLSRVDTNDAVGGKYPVFDADAGEININGAMGWFRNSYIRESGDEESSNIGKA